MQSAMLPNFDAATLTVQPIERSETIPASWYTSPAFHDHERDTIFARSWQYAGHVCQLPNAGDIRITTVADNPILLVRDQHGALHAFYNVCRHRAGPIATEHSCGARMLQCKYHGWTYTLAGQLRGVTQLHPRYSLQYSPFKRDADNSMYGAQAAEAFYYWVFPNLMFNIIAGRLQLNHVMPVDADHCEVIFDYFYDDVNTPAALTQIETDIAYSEMVQREDEEICVLVQRGLHSRAYTTGRFSVEREEGVHHFQSLLKQALLTPSILAAK